MSKTKKTYLEQLGLKPVDKLTKTICKQRVAHLRKKISSGRLPPKLLKQAKYYANWYGWMADNGGTRGQQRRSA